MISILSAITPRKGWSELHLGSPFALLLLLDTQAGNARIDSLKESLPSIEIRTAACEGEARYSPASISACSAWAICARAWLTGSS